MAKSGVFISYARVDGQELATTLSRRMALEIPEIKVWRDRVDIEGGVGWWRQIEEALERVEFLVTIMTPGTLASEVTRQEWRAARQHGVCVFPVRGPGFRIDDARMPAWMRRAHIYDLDDQWQTFVAHLRRGCQITRVPAMAPPLPASFIERPQAFNAVRSLLLDPRTKDAVAITTTLAGTGGFGKTTLAVALCHDEDVITAFDDGVLWATLGQSPNVQGELTRLYAALTGERPSFVSIEDAAQAVAEKLEHKRCLIAIDDVWDVAHLRPFLRGGAGCARLVTTRQAQVAAEGARVVVDEMTNQEAVSLLTARLDRTPVDLNDFKRLARRLCEWPLLLRLTGAVLRQRLDRGDSLSGALRYVDRALDKRGLLAFDREVTAGRGPVGSTLGMSLDLLEPEDRDRCLRLGVFPEDAAVPVVVIAELWALDDLDTEESLARLDDASKAAQLSHHRVASWCAWFAGLMDTRPTDRMYDCLPMHHSVGGVVAPGATLLAGGSVVIRERFSASRFWSDVVETRCTLFQYIGELCRYIVNTPDDPAEHRHRLRLCAGNGMRPDIWTRFQERFTIPRSWNSTPRPRARCRSTTSRAGSDRSAACRPSCGTARRPCW